MSLLDRLETWLKECREEKLLRAYGGIQTCPWCRQCAQEQDGWGFRQWDRDPFLDVLTCGVCKGTSLWRFELGMMYVAPLDPPSPLIHTPWFGGHYDVENAKWVNPWKSKDK